MTVKSAAYDYHHIQAQETIYWHADITPIRTHVGKIPPTASDPVKRGVSSTAVMTSMHMTLNYIESHCSVS